MTITTRECADRLLAVASHLADHPDLAPVDVFTTSGTVQPHGVPRDDRPAALLAWAQSLDGDRMIEVRNQYDAAYCEAHGEINGHEIVVFTVLSKLAYDMGDVFDGNEHGGRAWITLDALQAWVEHGTRPLPADETLPA